MIIKKIALLPFLFFYFTSSGQKKTEKSQVIGDTVVVSTLRNKKVFKERYYLKDKLVLEKKYYYKRDFYESIIKYPVLVNKKAIGLKSFWVNGKPRIDGFSLDGKNPEGLYRTYHVNGQPQCICNYKNGKRDGTQLYYFDNGQLGSRIIYADGVPQSIIENYTRDGKVSQEGTLKDGNGTFFIYNKGEKLSKIEYYKAGVLVKTEKVKDRKFSQKKT
ncbi:MAG: toxin-antitoxin system YwqK family antitoxin [Sphingobacteriaceae bacterium]